MLFFSEKVLSKNSCNPLEMSGEKQEGKNTLVSPCDRRTVLSQVKNTTTIYIKYHKFNNLRNDTG